MGGLGLTFSSHLGGLLSLTFISFNVPILIICSLGIHVFKLWTADQSVTSQSQVTLYKITYIAKGELIKSDGFINLAMMFIIFFVVNIVSMEITYFICGVIYGCMVRSRIWDYAITVTIFHVMLSSLGKFDIHLKLKLVNKNCSFDVFVSRFSCYIMIFMDLADQYCTRFPNEQKF